MLKAVPAILLVGLLAGCADKAPQVMSRSAADTDSRASAAERSVRPGTRAETARAPEGRSLLAFVGQSRHDLVSWLGQPDLELSEGHGSLLQFRRGQCVALAMVGEGDSVAAIEVSGVDVETDADCAERKLAPVTRQ